MSKGKLIVAIIILAIVVVGGSVLAFIYTNKGQGNVSDIEQAPPASGQVKVTSVQVVKSPENQSFIDVTIFVKNESKVKKGVAIQVSLMSDATIEPKLYSLSLSNMEPGEERSATLINIKDFAPDDKVRAGTQIVAEY